MECANCNKPATLACRGCKECPTLEGEVGTVRYCGAACQKDDWPHHKATCIRLRDRQILYRVASTAQKLWYMSRELTWYIFEITRVDRDEEDMQRMKLLHPGSSTLQEALNLHGNKLPQPVYHTPIPFPAHLLSSKQDREAALSNEGCYQAVLWMVEFIEGMLGRIVTQTVQVEHRTMGEKRYTKFYPLELPKDSIRSLFGPRAFDCRKLVHAILKVTLRSGEVFAVDLAGAQYGHHEPVTPWKEYERTQILNLVDVGPAPLCRGFIQVHDCSVETVLPLFEKHRKNSGTNSIMVDMFELMNLALLTWEKEVISLKDLWKMPENKFLVKQTDLVDFIDWVFNLDAEWSTVHGRELRKQFPDAWVYCKE